MMADRTSKEAVAASQTATTGGRKFDGGKSQYGLLPPLALEENVKVLTYGAQKYEPDNWKRVPDGPRRYFDAAQRHIWAYKRGEQRDPETGLHHLAHAICCLEFILDLDLAGEQEVEQEVTDYAKWIEEQVKELRITVEERQCRAVDQLARFSPLFDIQEPESISEPTGRGYVDQDRDPLPQGRREEASGWPQPLSVRDSGSKR